MPFILRKIRMKTKFAVVWHNTFFNQNKWKVQHVHSISAAYAFVEWLDKQFNSCGYKLNFMIRNANEE